MIFAIYPLLAAFAASVVFYYAWLWLKTPFLLNVLGSVSVFISVLSLISSIAYSSSPLIVEEPGTSTAILTSVEFFGLAGLAYFIGYLLRAYALKAGLVTDGQDDVDVS